MKKNSETVDYLIIGQGLAGTVLAYQLLKRGRRVRIIDKKDPNSSSRIAAGLFNPITGRKFVKTWKADELFYYLKWFYQEFENYLGASFFHEREIYRPFDNLGEQNDWVTKCKLPEYKPYVEVVYDPERFSNVHNLYGGLLVKKGGFLDVNTMLDAARKKFIEEGCLIEKEFDHDDINLAEGKIEYENIIADRLVMCTGSHKISKGWFSWLPFRPVKGEVLLLDQGDGSGNIYNKGCFITPQLHGYSKAGSTYDWKDLTIFPTEHARHTILTKLNALIKWEVKVIDQKAGIRPATLDRKPFIGVHPKFETIFIFNGLGTKGVSLAPYYSGQFVGYLEDALKLEMDVDIKRYYSLYYKSYSQ